MRVMTIAGTRPELIRLSIIVEKLDASFEHLFAYTGQNFTPSLRDVFFEELGLRNPDVDFGIVEPMFGAQVGRILSESESLFLRFRPDALVVLGDTNSGLSAIVAKRLGVLVFHIEAGNRCFDDEVPEEVNRRIIDHSSDVLMPYTERSRQNLIREGIGPERVFVIGNPILEVLKRHEPRVQQSGVLGELGLQEQKYILATAHRAETVDREDRLRSLFDAWKRLAARFQVPVVASVHPRTRARLDAAGLGEGDGQTRLLEPLGLFDFVRLEKAALLVVSDSGTVQEECCIFGVPAVTTRRTTERPETVECGSNIVSGVDAESVLRCACIALGRRGEWRPPEEYLRERVSETVVSVIAGSRSWC